MKFQVLNEQAEDFTHTKTAFPHEQNDTAELKVINGSQECLEIGLFHDLDTPLRFFEFDNPLHGLSSASMDKERLETTKTIGNLLIEHRVGQRLPSLDVITIEAA